MVEVEVKRRMPADERRAQIIDAAERLFGEAGYDSVRLDRIAEEVGVTKPILYRHFGSKQDLYIAVLARHGTDFDSFAMVVPDDGSMEERLRTVLDAWFGYVETHAYAWRMLFRDSGGGPAVGAVRAEVHSRARTVLAELIGELRQVPIPGREHEPLGEMLSMGMAGLVLWWIDDPDISRAAIVDSMTRVWAGLLSRHPGT